MYICAYYTVQFREIFHAGGCAARATVKTVTRWITLYACLLLFFCCYFSFCSETRCCYVAQVGLKIPISLASLLSAGITDTLLLLIAKQ